ncbi:hypothetical protein BUALT_Bualt05G0061200 [Buddleja alternifolia]|uniref:Generative cell specific-1/HAP2 domain-containing protein n=1 Tax=Buddleja alternifolia TaxID=168488 RepID=A0AAV6XIY6_9LAMI|nr:hypothetical protein BUALT_Bualt05G0061200 [Buddleja alternifolia]
MGPSLPKDDDDEEDWYSLDSKIKIWMYSSVDANFLNSANLQNAGSHAFSIGITEVLNTNLLVELSADDIEYVYQRSPGKILGITVPTFEALTQFGTATITTKNIGELEASYSLTFDCSSGVSQMEEQFYIMQPNEVITRSFKLYPTTDQAAKYACSAILKDSDFSEVDRAECQFTTTATVIENGSQICGIDYGMVWQISSLEKVAAVVLLWLLHQKGLFDPIYDWWEDHIWTSDERNDNGWKHGRNDDLSLIHLKKNHRHEKRHHKHDVQRRRSNHTEHRHNNIIGESDYNYYLHHVHKEKHKHGRIKNSGISQHVHDDRARHHHRRRKERIPLAE